MNNYTTRMLSNIIGCALPLAVILLFQTEFNPLYAQTLDKGTIVLGGTNSTKNSFHGRWLELIYTEAFRRLGYSFVYKSYPGKRASFLSDQGETDGEITRVFSYGEKHPNVLRVEEPHFIARFSAYSARQDITLDGWDSLKGTDFKVIYRLGVKLTESNVPKVVEPSRLMTVRKVDQGLRILDADRADVFIDVESVIEDALSSNPDFKQSQIHRVGVMASISAHAHLHIRNRQLVEPLSTTLKAMRQEGLIDKYRDQAKE